MFLAVSRVKSKGGYTSTAIANLKDLSKEAKASGATSVTIGSVQTGAHAGSILALQVFETMSDIEAVYDTFASSKLYQEILASDEIELTGRALLKMHHRQRTSDDGKYMVLTKFEAETEMLDEAKAVMGLFMDNGAVGCAYGTFMAGSFVGHHLIGARYPSMQAIQEAYESVSDNGEYQSAVSKAKISFRNILRLA